MTLYTYYLCHALLVSRITCVTHYLCHALLFQCIFAGEYSRLSSLLTIRRCPPPPLGG